MASQSSLINYGLQAGEKQIIPDYTRFEHPTKQSVILDRSKVSYVPVSGQTYTVGGTSGNSTQLTFLISDSSRFLDLPTSFLTFDYVLTGNPAGATSYLDTLPADGAVSLFNRCQVKLNGILLEDTTQLNQAFNSRMVTTMNRDYYENQHDILCGSWLWNQSYGGAKGVTDPADVTTRLKASQRTSYTAVANVLAGSASTTRRSFSIPMSFLSGLFSSNGLLPLPLTSSLEIALFFDDIYNSHYSLNTSAQNTTAQLSYSLTNVRIMADLCEMNSAYGQLLKQICYEDAEGLNIAFDTIQSFSLNYASGSGNIVENQQVFNKASPMVRSVLCSKSVQAKNRDIQGLYAVSFKNNGNTGVRISCGSIYNPVAGHTQNNSTTYAVLRSQDIANVISGGVQNMSTYSGVAWNGTDATAVTYDGVLTNHTFGFDFDKSRGECERDGIDSSALGSAFVIYNRETQVSATAMILNVFVHYTRHLCMRGGVLSVSG